MFKKYLGFVPLILATLLTLQQVAYINLSSLSATWDGISLLGDLAPFVSFIGLAISWVLLLAGKKNWHWVLSGLLVLATFRVLWLGTFTAWFTIYLGMIPFDMVPFLLLILHYKINSSFKSLFKTEIQKLEDKRREDKDQEFENSVRMYQKRYQHRGLEELQMISASTSYSDEAKEAAKRLTENNHMPLD